MAKTINLIDQLINNFDSNSNLNNHESSAGSLPLRNLLIAGPGLEEYYIENYIGNCYKPNFKRELYPEFKENTTLLESPADIPNLNINNQVIFNVHGKVFNRNTLNETHRSMLFKTKEINNSKAFTYPTFKMAKNVQKTNKKALKFTFGTCFGAAVAWDFWRIIKEGNDELIKGTVIHIPSSSEHFTYTGFEKKDENQIYRILTETDQNPISAIAKEAARNPETHYVIVITENEPIILKIVSLKNSVNFEKHFLQSGFALYKGVGSLEKIVNNFEYYKNIKDHQDHRIVLINYPKGSEDQVNDIVNTIHRKGLEYLASNNNTVPVEYKLLYLKLLCNRDKNGKKAALVEELFKIHKDDLQKNITPKKLHDFVTLTIGNKSYNASKEILFANCQGKLTYDNFDKLIRNTIDSLSENEEVTEYNVDILKTMVKYNPNLQKITSQAFFDLIDLFQSNKDYIAGFEWLLSYYTDMTKNQIDN